MAIELWLLLGNAALAANTNDSAGIMISPIGLGILSILLASQDAELHEKVRACDLRHPLNPRSQFSRCQDGQRQS